MSDVQLDALWRMESEEIYFDADGTFRVVPGQPDPRYRYYAISVMEPAGPAAPGSFVPLSFPEVEKGGVVSYSIPGKGVAVGDLIEVLPRRDPSRDFVANRGGGAWRYNADDHLALTLATYWIVRSVHAHRDTGQPTRMVLGLLVRGDPLADGNRLTNAHKVAEIWRQMGDRGFQEALMTEARSRVVVGSLELDPDDEPAPQAVVTPKDP